MCSERRQSQQLKHSCANPKWEVECDIVQIADLSLSDLRLAKIPQCPAAETDLLEAMAILVAEAALQPSLFLSSSSICVLFYGLCILTSFQANI